jgi:hypothetical protein
MIRTKYSDHNITVTRAMIDFRIIILLLMVCIFIYVISNQDNIKIEPKKIHDMKHNKTNNQIIKSSEMTTEQIYDFNNNYGISYDDIEPIRIPKDSYNHMVDIITDYSLKYTDFNEKLQIIYLSTFHLFDENFGAISIKKLDESIVNYPYISPPNISFPEGNLYHNLQKAIISNITGKIVNSDLQFMNDREKDRVLIDIYLNNLFTTIGIM